MLHCSICQNIWYFMHKIDDFNMNEKSASLCSALLGSLRLHRWWGFEIGLTFWKLTCWMRLQVILQQQINCAACKNNIVSQHNTNHWHCMSPTWTNFQTKTTINTTTYKMLNSTTYKKNHKESNNKNTNHLKPAQQKSLITFRSTCISFMCKTLHYHYAKW